MAKSREGGCVCGAVRYRVKAAPQVGLICHCTWCQKRTGSAFSFNAYFLEKDVEIVSGRLSQYEHRSDETGRWLRTEFCPVCGTPITRTAELRPGWRAIAAGTLDDPERLPDRAPHLGALRAAVGGDSRGGWRCTRRARRGAQPIRR